MLVPGNFVIILDIFTSFCDAKVVLINAPFACPFYQVMHTVPWLNSSVTLLVSKAPLNREVKNGCFWVDWTFAFAVQNSGGH